MATLLESNKTKIAKRVIEVFEFFDDTSQKATVMDIVRRYGRPQSSTSELLASLVDLGFLYKDPRSRSYSPTPRLATLGTSAQPSIVRDGRLFSFMDQLAQSSRHSVSLFGIVGTYVQVFRSSPGAGPLACILDCGASEPLSSSTAGHLLLSTLGSEQVTRMLWRLNSEAAAKDKFNPAELAERVASLRSSGQCTGPAGFVAGAQMTAMLLPRSKDDRPLAVGMTYAPESEIDTDALLATLNHGVKQSGASVRPDAPTATFAPFMMTA